MLTYWKLHRIPLLITLVAAVFYSYFFHVLDRGNFIQLLCLYTALFYATFKLIQFEKWNFRLLISIGILFRLLSLTAIPNLSQDFYRFIWDGHLMTQGISPYLHLPKELILDPNFNIPNKELLFDKMGALSAKHYSNYPPLNQILFTIAAALGGKYLLGNILVLKLFIVISDIGILLLGRKILKYLNISSCQIFWYFLNPLVIIELTGNLHFEGVMLFFFIGSIYFLIKNKWIIAAMFYAAAISVKLVPLLFLPIFLKYFKFTKAVFFYVIIGMLNIILFLPFFTSEFITHYSQTIGLWFTNFEFNASIYYVIRWIGYQIKGYNIIQHIGKFTPFIIITIVLGISFLRKNNNIKQLITSMLLILTAYFMLSTTLHPWYVINLLLLGILANFKYPLVWSFTVILSYFAYRQNNFDEQLWIIIIEYLPFYTYLIYEFFNYKRSKISIS